VCHVDLFVKKKEEKKYLIEESGLVVGWVTYKVESP
jgi:hypothetical protein